MSKVDWITWNTDLREIMNPEKVMERINDNYQDYYNSIHSYTYETIKQEMQIGGLDVSSLNIYGDSPISEKATNILNSMDEIASLYANLKNRMRASLEEQKKEEKKELIRAIEEKIEEEKKKLENTEYLKNRVSSNQVIPVKDVEEIIDNTNEKIRRLQEKLESAKKL